MKNTKITNDGFIWLLVNDKAKEIFLSELFQLFELRDDDSESLIETFEDLKNCLENGIDIGIEVGQLPKTASLTDLKSIQSKISDNTVSVWEDNLQGTRDVVALEGFSKGVEGLEVTAILLSMNVKAQIDISCDASFVGIYPTTKVTYPLYDKIIIGGAFGYNVSSPYLSEKFDFVCGYKFDEWIQIECDLGVYSGYNPGFRDVKEYVFHADFGVKCQSPFNTFFTIQVAYPGFAKIGFGIRLRPYKKLTVWDKQ